jgi:hypothetical protein
MHLNIGAGGRTRTGTVISHRGIFLTVMAFATSLANPSDRGTERQRKSLEMRIAPVLVDLGRVSSRVRHLGWHAEKLRNQ